MPSPQESSAPPRQTFLPEKNTAKEGAVSGRNEAADEEDCRPKGEGRTQSLPGRRTTTLKVRWLHGANAYSCDT